MNSAVHSLGSGDGDSDLEPGLSYLLRLGKELQAPRLAGARGALDRLDFPSVLELAQTSPCGENMMT